MDPKEKVPTISQTPTPETDHTHIPGDLTKIDQKKQPSHVDEDMIDVEELRHDIFDLEEEEEDDEDESRFSNLFTSLNSLNLI